MQDFEKLGLFYLGRRYDMAARRAARRGGALRLARPRDPRRVRRHDRAAARPGLCLSLIEEAAIDGVPVIAIDPKGDLGNLLLTFPQLSAAEFRPWIDEDEARRQGQTADAFAAAEAERWRAGLAEWGQDGARIERLRSAADFTIYTPGSRAGVPVSILSSFAAPSGRGPRRRRGAGRARRQHRPRACCRSPASTRLPAAASTRSSPACSAAAWADGRDLDLATLIQQVQTPPFAKVGVVDLEAFFPAKDRFELAMRLNGLLAAPGFAQWLEGEPLDPASLLYSPKGKPRVAVFSIAHLGDAERMFFVSLLLNQVVAWMRGQTGTTSLRAVLYMDEILGYFPPVANPPSKAPLMTLLKQGRAFGLGVVLATQNPVDLDYKGLANTGTWFLGRLQTERDKARMLDGLEGAAAGSMDRAETDRLLSALDKRVFLLHNVHDKAPVVFQTRWTLSYLQGTAVEGPDSGADAGSAGDRRVQRLEAGGAAKARRPPRARSRRPADRGRRRRRSCSPGIQQYFVPAAGCRQRSLHAGRPWRGARRRLATRSSGSTRSGTSSTPRRSDRGAVAVDWATATRVDVATADLRGRRPGRARRTTRCRRRGCRRRTTPRGTRTLAAGSRSPRSSS